MEKFRKKLLVLIFLAAGFAVSMTAWATHKPGSFFFGDADGDGIMSGNDWSALSNVVMDPSDCNDNYTAVHPASCNVADLNGDGSVDCLDLATLQYWLTGNWITALGVAYYLDSDWQYDIQHGTSTEKIYAYVYDSDSSARAGWGVIFKVTDTSTCSGATLKGRLVSNGESIDWGTSVFEYSSTSGVAEVLVKVPAGCAAATTINVEIYIPSDTEALVPGQRFPNKLDPGSHITITVED